MQVGGPDCSKASVNTGGAWAKTTTGHTYTYTQEHVVERENSLHKYLQTQREGVGVDMYGLVRLTGSSKEGAEAETGRDGPVYASLLL